MAFAGRRPPRRDRTAGQSPAIFTGSLARNVTLGRPGIDREAVAEALRFARLDAVAAARGGAPIGEDGLGLSGGEALRLAIARAAVTPGRGSSSPTSRRRISTPGRQTRSPTSCSRSGAAGR